MDADLPGRVLAAQPRPVLRPFFAARVASAARSPRSRRRSPLVVPLWILASGVVAPSLLASEWLSFGGLVAVPLVMGLTAWGVPELSLRSSRRDG